MEEPIVEATNEAERQDITGWFSLGFFLGVIGILIVYLRSPQTPAIFLAKYKGHDQLLFSSAYVETLKARQIKYTWIGFAIGFGFGIFLFVALIDTIF